MEDWSSLLAGPTPRREDAAHRYARQCAQDIYAWAEPGAVLHCRKIKHAYRVAAASRRIAEVPDLTWNTYLREAGFARLPAQGRRYLWTKPSA